MLVAVYYGFVLPLQSTVARILKYNSHMVMVYFENLESVKGSGHYWQLLKIVVCVRTYLIMSNIELLIV